MSGATFDANDPVARPVVAAQAELAREDLAAGDVDRCVVEAFAYGDEAAAEISRHVEPGRPALACAAGCSACCRGTTVLASTPEILHLARHVGETLSGEALATLRARVGAAADSARRESMADRARRGAPCPLLDEASGRCTAYEARPFSCRAFHSFDRAACERALGAGELAPNLPSSPVLFKVRHAVSLGVMAGAHALGLDAAPYELASALDDALEAAARGDDLRARWLAGERVLRPTEATEHFRGGYRGVLDAICGALDAAGPLAPLGPPPLAGVSSRSKAERNKRKRDRKRR